MCEFEKGQIVYVSLNGHSWDVSHFVVVYTGAHKWYSVTPNYDDAMSGNGTVYYKYCLSVEDYHKMLKQPKDKDLVWAWDSCFVPKPLKVCGFYDKEGDRIMNGFKYEIYEVIPREQWPQWAVEAYELLED